MGMGILQPAVALMIWTMIIWAWMYASRIPAMQKAEIAPDDAQVTGLLDQKLPREVQWKAHNYNHLHEQPTIFYAVCIVLAIIGAGDGLSAFLAWIYMGLRVIHSIVQVTANKVMVRFVLFALSSVVLMVLIMEAALVVFGGGPDLTGQMAAPIPV
jgi:hypothetical protein